jgi:ribonuclease HI
MDKIVVYTDGGARGNPGNAGVGVFIADAKGKMIKEVAKAIGVSTNNFAEYEAVITALETLKKLYGKKTTEIEFEFRMDSQLVQRQLIGQYRVKDKGLQEQFARLSKLREKHFPNISFHHIMREENNLADGLANKAMDQEVENHAVRGTGRE